MNPFTEDFREWFREKFGREPDPSNQTDLDFGECWDDASSTEQFKHDPPRDD